MSSRSKILQLKRIREVRAEKRYKDYLAAKAALERAEQALAELMAEQDAVYHEILVRSAAIAPSGETARASEIERRTQSVDQLRNYLGTMSQKIDEAEALRQDCEAKTAEAKQIYRNAQKSVDQIVKLDERIAEEEVRMLEIMEEMLDESRGKPQLPMDKPA